MKFLLFSDTHITSKAEFSKPTEDGLTDYLHRVIKSFEWIESLVDKHDPKFVAMLGDLFDTTGFVDTPSLHVGAKVCSRLISTCCALDKGLYWLVGNHDIYSEWSHNLKFLGLSAWGKVISRAFTVSYAYPCKVMFLPWGTEPCYGDYDIVLSHSEVKGGVLNPKKRSENGLDPNYGPWIFNGHYHLPDQLGERCIQVGSLLSKDFRDGPSNNRGAVLVEYNNGECSVERLVNPHEIPYRTVTISEDRHATLWRARLDKGVTGLEDSFVKVIYDEKYKDEAEQISYLTKGSRLEVRSKPLPEVRDNVVNESFSPEDNFRKYVEDVLLFDDDKEADLILAKGLEYLKSVKNDLSTTTQPIEFKSLRIKGFQSIRDISIDLHNQGLIWVGGSNGVGKTTLLESLFWVLTGKSARHGDRSGDDVIGWHTDTCEVSVDLSIGGNDYTITRGRKPNKVSLYLGEDDISARLARDTDAKIKDLVGRSKDVLQHSIFLTSGLNTRFTALSYPDRIRLFESITDAGVYSKVERLVKADIKKVYSELAHKQGVEESIAGRLTSLDKRLHEVRGSLIEAKRDLEAKREGLLSHLKELVDQRKEFTLRLKESRKEEAAVEEDTRLLNSRAEMVTSAVDILSSKLTVLDTKSRYLDKDLQNKANLIAKGQCPTCFSKDVKTSLAGYIEERQNEFEKIKHEMRSSLLPKLDSYRQKNSEQKELLQESEKGLRNIRSEVSTIQAKISELDKTISSIKMEINASSSNVDRLEAKEEEILSSKEADQANLDAVRSEIDWLNSKEGVLSFLVKAFSTSGIRARMLSTVTVPFINSRIENYSSTLSLPFSITNRVESKSGSEDNKLEVVLPGKRTYRSCSRGERRRIDLAIQCAINDLAIATGGSKVNLLVADEVIDPLDDSGVKAFVGILQDKSKDSTVILITHKPFIDSYAMKRWLLTKEYDVTNLQSI